jgi:outer membrane protein insertion porin family
MILTWIFLLLQATLVFAAGELKVTSVQVHCPESESCQERRARFETLTGEYRSLVHLKDTLRVMASDGGYQNFTYVLSEVGKETVLDINFELKPVIREISVGFTDRTLEADPTQLLNLKEGEYYEVQKLNESISSLQKRIEGLGFPHNNPVFEVVEKKDGVNINVAVTLGKPMIFKNIKTDATSTFVAEFLTKKFYNLYNKPFELNRFKLYLDGAQRELFSYGYYLINLDFNPIIKNDRVTLDIKVSNDKLFAVDIKKYHFEDRDVLQNLVIDLFRKYKRPLSESVLKQGILDHYQTRGMLNVGVKIETSQFQNMYKETVTLFRIFVHETKKTRLMAVNFIGNSFYNNKNLKKFFDKDAYELASVGFYDREYLANFVDLLRTRYIKAGFVQVKIQGPTTSFTHNNEEVSVDYIIQEGPRAFVRNVLFEGLPSEYEGEVLGQMSNKVGKPFDPMTMLGDVKKITAMLQEQGFYYAEITNTNDDALVKYSSSGTDVDIILNFNLGPQIRLNRILFMGNNRTRKKVLMKKITLKSGDLITPSKTREIESALSTMGLFSTVQVEPIRHSSSSALTDLVVRVSEREYGLIEVAPGYRTDLGPKLGTTFQYMNIGGMNRSVTVGAQINQRLNFSTIDPQRRKNAKTLLEYNVSASFTQGNIFDTDTSYTASVSQQRRRYYPFDADIQRVSNSFSRVLTKTVSASLRHQLEKVNQWDGTIPEQNGHFRIGSLSPNLTWDLRNSPTLPTKGAFFNINTEVANPFFLSQSDPNLTINYYKVISRNRFYIPFKNGTVAISMTAGMEQNLEKQILTQNGQPIQIQQTNPENNENLGTINQTKGFIPSIKAFRLTGMDIVRGYADNEINRVQDGRDISQVRIQNAAYMANFKLEPRYFINDTFMTGVFFDAGRVYVDQMDLGDLRTSTGITFKFITPVGTLDFDYGIKTLRKRLPNGRLEDPGRFHVSIGFF